MDGRVRFLGWMPDVTAVLRQADVIVLPSEGEPFGLAMVEGCAEGLLPIAFSDGGGALECIPPDGRVVRASTSSPRCCEQVKRIRGAVARGAARKVGLGARPVSDLQDRRPRTWSSTDPPRRATLSRHDERGRPHARHRRRRARTDAGPGGQHRRHAPAHPVHGQPSSASSSTGLWVFLNAVVAFAGLLEVGVGRGSIRFIAFYGERRSYDVVRRIVSYGMPLPGSPRASCCCPLAWLLGQSASSRTPASRLAPRRGRDAASARARLLLPDRGRCAFWRAADRLRDDLARRAGHARHPVRIRRGSSCGSCSEGLELYGLLIAVALQSILQGIACYVIGRRLIGPVFGNPFALGRPCWWRCSSSAGGRS